MTRSNNSSIYDEDFYAWTQQQAALLRRMPAAPDVDIAHVAEEIEDMGKRDLREVRSLLTRLLEHLLKIACAPMSLDAAHWSSEAYHFQFEAMGAFSPSMRRLLDVTEIWQTSRRRAESYIEVATTFIPPATCPFALDDLLSRDFDIGSAMAVLRAASHSAD